MKTRPTRLMTLLLALILLVGGLTACSRGRKKLSKLSDEEIRQYLADAEVEIPDDMEMSSIRELIAFMEKAPSFGGSRSNPTYVAFCMELGAAVYAGRRGHPVLVGRRHWAGVASGATGDAGARAYLEQHADELVLVEVGDVAGGDDLDHRLLNP